MNTNIREKLELFYKRRQMFNLMPNDVCTPPSLVQHMLNQLPQEVFSSTTITFCDITCGMGTFLLETFVKCFEALENIIPNEQERVKNILSRLYGFDNDEIAIKTAKVNFKKFLCKYITEDSSINIQCQDILESDFNNMKFDILLGNPPYNPDVIEKTSKGSSTGQKIWHKFIEKAFEIVNENGHLLYVTPHNWREGNFQTRSPLKNIRNLIFSNNIKWYIDAKSYFPTVGTSISINAWYVSIGEKSAFCNDLQLLPSDIETISTVSKFFKACLEQESINFLNRRGTAKFNDLLKQKEGDQEHQYRVANTSAQVKNGIFNWTKEKPTCYDLRKLIVSCSGQYVAMYDTGTCATGEHCGAYVFEENDNEQNLIDFLKSPLFSMISLQFMVKGSIAFPMHLFTKLPKSILSLSWDQDNWIESAKQVFDFSNEEIEIIKKYV